MALNIKDQDTHALARRLAAATGESLTEAVRTAVAERLTRVERAAGRADDDLVARLNAIARHCGSLPVQGTRTEDEILGYDERGLPGRMVIDSSALVAMLQDEPERAAFVAKIAADPVRLLSAANYLEVAIVIDDRFGAAGARDLKLLLVEAAIRIMPVTVEHAELARTAYRRFGRGNHPARLNFGDCFAYGLARETGEPLLYKGGDFGQTDIAAA